MWTIPRGPNPMEADVHFDAFGRFLVVTTMTRAGLHARDAWWNSAREDETAKCSWARWCEMVTQLPASWDRGRNQLPDSRGEDRPMLTFGEDIMPYRADRFEFSTDGKFLASGSCPGTPFLIFSQNMGGSRNSRLR